MIYRPCIHLRKVGENHVRRPTTIKFLIAVAAVMMMGGNVASARSYNYDFGNGSSIQGGSNGLGNMINQGG